MEDTIQRVAKRESWLRASQNIALCIHYYMNKNMMSFEDLANKTDISTEYLKGILQGKENITVDTVNRIQTALDADFIDKPYNRKYILVSWPEIQYVMDNDRFNECLFVDNIEYHNKDVPDSSYMVPEDLYNEIF